MARDLVPCECRGDDPAAYCPRHSREVVVCAPLCGASKAYGRFDKPWKHEHLCPVWIEWDAQRKYADYLEADATIPDRYCGG